VFQETIEEKGGGEKRQTPQQRFLNCTKRRTYRISGSIVTVSTGCVGKGGIKKRVTKWYRKQASEGG